MPDGPMPKDYEIMIDVLVDDCIKDLVHRFPGRLASDFVLRVRAFVPVIVFQKGFIKEDFRYDSPQVHVQHDFFENREMDFSREDYLLKVLKERDFTRFVEQKVMSFVVQSDNVSYTDLENDYRLKNALMPRRFLDWVCQPYAVQRLIVELQEESGYKWAFSRFSSQDLESHLKEAMVNTFERRFRAGIVREYVDNLYDSYLSMFSTHSMIKAMLYTMVVWNELNMPSWFDDHLCCACSQSGYSPEVLRRLEGNENILVAEIMPVSSKMYSVTGGKTIKIASDRAVQTMFKTAQAVEKESLVSQASSSGPKADSARKELEKFRWSFQEMLFARRYILPESVEQAIILSDALTNLASEEEDAEILLGDIEFRRRAYREHYLTSKRNYLDNEGGVSKRSKVA